MFDLFTTAGILGAIVVIATYFANQHRWLSAEDWRFPALNLAGACLILVSLTTAWNLPSAIVEACWAAISVYGLSRGRLRAK